MLPGAAAGGLRNACWSADGVLAVVAGGWSATEDGQAAEEAAAMVAGGGELSMSQEAESSEQAAMYSSIYDC